MNINVTIKFKDSFDTEMTGMSESINIDEQFVDSHIEEIVEHFKRACLACGFNSSTVEKIIYDEVTK